jgi:hypothetical protein
MLHSVPRALAERIRARCRDLPPDVTAQAKPHLLDTIGAMLMRPRPGIWPAAS